MLGAVGSSPCELVEEAEICTLGGMRLSSCELVEREGEIWTLGGVMSSSDAAKGEEETCMLGGVRSSPSPEPAEGAGEPCVLDGEGWMLVASGALSVVSTI